MSSTTITKEMASAKSIRAIHKEFIKHLDKKEQAELMKNLGEKLKGSSLGKRKAIYRKIHEKYGDWEKRAKKEDDEESVSSFGEKEDEVREIDFDVPPFTPSCDEESEEEIDQEQELKEAVEKMEKRELEWIEGIALSEAIFNTLPDEAKRVMIEDVMEKNRLKDELTKNTTRHHHAKREGQGKKKPQNSKSEIYEVWSHQFNNGNPPDWFRHTIMGGDGKNKVIDEWYFEYDPDWGHYEVNWEKSKTKIPKTSLSFNTFLTCNENHQKAIHKFRIEGFAELYEVEGEDEKEIKKKLQQKFKALSKPTFTFQPMATNYYEKCYEAMKKAKEEANTKKTKKTK